MKNIILLIPLFFSIACGSDDVKKDLANLLASPIQLPLNSTVTYEGQDTTITDLFESRLKMVIYTDSNGCSSCSLSKLHLWHEIIDCTSEHSKELKFYFIFNPPQGKNLRFELRNSLIEYPLLVDSLGEFELLNPHLPKNPALHTFLLDENNNVILVGNPLQNPQIEKLFKEEVEKRLGGVAN